MEWMVLQEFRVDFTVGEVNVWESLIYWKAVESEVVKNGVVFKLDGGQQ